jgi:hypothetical protein
VKEHSYFQAPAFSQDIFGIFIFTGMKIAEIICENKGESK